MRIECLIPKATNTHLEYVVLSAFALQQWLHQRAALLPYTILPASFRLTTKNAILLTSEVGLFLTLKTGLKRHSTPHYDSFNDIITWVLDKEATVSYIEIILILPFILYSWGCRSLMIEIG